MRHLLYLHGFRSSPQSAKAQRTLQALERLRTQGHDISWFCPALPPSPQQAMDMVMAHIATWPSDEMGVVGSSLGGYYATWVAQQKACKAVLLNPAVEPARDLAQYIGQQKTWHSDEDIFFKPEYIDQLNKLYVRELTLPQNFFVIATQGDEVLDWREMAAKYAHTHLHVQAGGDHALSNYEDWIDPLMQFLRAPPSL